MGAAFDQIWTMARVMGAGFLCKRDFFPFGKEEKPRCCAREWMRLSLEGKKIPAHMTRANVAVSKNTPVQMEKTR
jgi:hypothetical protein